MIFNYFLDTKNNHKNSLLYNNKVYSYSLLYNNKVYKEYFLGILMENELYKQNPWWEEKKISKDIDNWIEREKYLEDIFSKIDKNEILFLTGLRRIGKTTIMKQIISRLLKNVNKTDICFVSLDSFSLIENSIHDIIEEYRRIHKKSIEDFFYLFLDEITFKDNFPHELKSLYDNDNIKIICSSSIASLMNDKKAYLTGRTRTIEILPLDFKEFLNFKKVKINKSDRARLEAYFRDYIKVGGIPRYVLEEDEAYLRELVDSIIYKDIIAHYSLTNERVVRELFLLLCERVGKPISYNKLSNILGISVNSVKRYVSYFEKAYLFYSVSRFSKSFNENITSPKKIYCGDVGIKNMVTGFRDLGASYENLVFLKIKTKNPSYYKKDSMEIDFITKDTLIEAKFNKKIEKKQKGLFDSIKRKNKTIAKGVDFFI